MADITATAVVEITKPVNWGRSSTAGWTASIGAFLLVACCPTLTHLNWIALEYYHGSLTTALKVALSEGPIKFASRHFPQPSTAAFVGYAIWLLLQAFFYGYLPGMKIYGQRTPGGHLLSYTANGLLAWAVSHVLYLGTSITGIMDPAIIAKHWEGLLVAVNTYGFVLAILAQWKGYLAPSFPEDRKMSGSWIFDFFAGVELNPRFGEYWDFKFFHNGRPGIVAWTLMCVTIAYLVGLFTNVNSDLSWAAYQYQTLGYITKSMLIVTLFHAIYVLDFFYNEDWYTRTIDISHDHFGFMLAWGDSTFLPTFYTLQVQYLARYPTHLTDFQALAILAFGLTGYAIFRSANHQKDLVRSNDGRINIWGRPAEFIRCKYRTDDGKEHNSLLITSGWWGVSRHANYLADLMQAWAMCATCGYHHFLPWSYFVYMTALLYHRSRRDEKRCRNKYGKNWEKYCELVPYRLIPGIY